MWKPLEMRLCMQNECVVWIIQRFSNIFFVFLLCFSFVSEQKIEGKPTTVKKEIWEMLGIFFMLVLLLRTFCERGKTLYLGV